MIRTNFSSMLPIYQTDNSYSLPSYTGAVQWNGNLKRFQVSNGGGWADIDNNVYFNVDPRINEMFEWVQKKMEQEKKMDNLAQKYPALKDAKEKFEIVYNLVTSGEK